MSTTSSLEREIKLAVPDRFRLPDLSDLAPGLTISRIETTNQTAVYYDTVDLRLARWDCGLRHRSNDGWTLKLGDVGTGPAVERREFLLTGDPGEPPACALDLVRAFCRGAPLEPVVLLRSERRRLTIRGRAGEPLAELTDDRVTADAGRVPATRFREVEIELGDACPDPLVEAILVRLRGAGAGPAHRMAKHARALGLEAGIAPEVVIPEIDADSDTGRVLRHALAISVATLVRSDPGVRADEDPEDVHRMRVSTRRLRSHLQTFQPLLEPEWADALRRELRELAALLGAVRDADVLGARFALRVGAAREPEQQAAKVLLERLDEARCQDRERLLAWLRSARHVELVEHLVTAAREPRLRCDPRAPAAELLAPPVWRRWKRLRRAVRRLGQPPSARDLHRVRIAAKHARYAAEAVEPVFGKRLGRLARAMRPLQDALGEHQDAVVARAWLRDAVAGLTSEAAFGAGGLAAREEAAAHEALRAWPAAWRRARRRARRCAAVLNP